VMESNKRKEDHRQLPRSSRRKFRHDLALECIERDYIGVTPLLGVEFKLMLAASRCSWRMSWRPTSSSSN
jgi:hypothetical protein